MQSMSIATGYGNEHEHEHEHERRSSISRLRSWGLTIRHNPKSSGILVTVMIWMILSRAGPGLGGVLSLGVSSGEYEYEYEYEYTGQSTAQQFPKIMHTASKCQKTSIFPFRVGCPNSCANWRSDVAVDSPEIFYRTNIAWYFGQPAAYSPASAHVGPKSQTAYDKGINFQCPYALAEHFVDASTDLAERVQARIPDTNTRTRLRVTHQQRMHLSLAYLCCLRANETDWVREIMHQWVMDTRPFDVFVTFDQVQCWHEASNSVTEIILVDAASQRKLTTLNHDLVRRLEAFGIPVSVPHEMQMPFHMTLQGFHRIGSADFSSMSQTDLRIMYEETERISNRMGSNWTGTSKTTGGGAMRVRERKRMRIQHEPRFGTTARVQVDPKLSN
jgi:hypothetical protein